MFRILIDTCVWLDIAKDPSLYHLIDVVEEMKRLEQLELVVPRIVIEELQRNRQRIEENSVRSTTSHFRIVRDAIKRAGGSEDKIKSILASLDDVNHKLPLIGGGAVNILNRIEALLSQAKIIELADEISLRAAKRVLEKKAPFHDGKNSMADAVIIETYSDCLRKKGNAGIRFAFVTHNTIDFSQKTGNKKIPHPDFDSSFTKIKSKYFISLSEALNNVDPDVVDEVLFERTWHEEPRGLAEILESEHKLFNQVWYNRHCNLRHHVESGLTKVVEKETYPKKPNGPETIQKDVWAMAQKSGRRVARSLGKDNIGPWDDFEWGMLNGKLSALRWILGEEWDMLDT